MIPGPALLAVAVAAAGGMLALGLLAARPHTRVDIERGHARLVRGSLPPGLLADLGDVARAAPDASGRVTLSGRAETLRVATRELPEHMDQRVRNVILLRRNQIRRG